MKLAVVTGSNRGIGLCLVKYLAEMDYEVYAACRNQSKELENLKNVNIIDGIDVKDEKSLTKLSNIFNNKKIDLLINNAGIMREENLNEFNFKTIQEQFEVNTLGPLKVTLSLKPFLSEGSKVVMITSRMGSIADNNSGGRYGYRMSKTALNMASSSLAFDLRPEKIAIGIIHPGYVKTDMTEHHGHITPDESAKNILERIKELNIDNTGTFWHSNGERLPW